MRKRTRTDIFAATNTLIVLSFLAENPEKEFVGSEIQRATLISRAGIYIALRDLVRQGLAAKVRRGSILMYSVRSNDPLVRQFKVLRNTFFLRRTVSKLKASSRKIILYGSASRGEDSSGSDLDLFVLSKDPEVTKSALRSVRAGRKIQAIVKSPSELADLKENDKTFFGEMDRGIVLWEETE